MQNDSEPTIRPPTISVKRTATVFELVYARRSLPFYHIVLLTLIGWLASTKFTRKEVSQISAIFE